MQRNFMADFGWWDDFPHARLRQERAALRSVMAVSGQSCSFMPHPKVCMGKD